MSNQRNRDSWNRLSPYYQATHAISLDDIHYSPYGPGEKELRIIGDVSGLDILELGCGSAQNAIVLAKWGAKSVTGLDQSEKQLEYAKTLAKSQGVTVKFVQENMENLSLFKDSSFDLIISSHAMNYVENLRQVFIESARVLRKNGRIVTCMGHPIMHLLWEALENKSLDKMGNYFSEERKVWDWHDDENKPIATFEETGYRFDEIINYLIQSGFKIEQVVEPSGYSVEKIKKMSLDTIPFRDVSKIDYKFVEIHQRIPFSLIVSAKKE
ncbi:MAG: class I SAM-dependent methyltransferase [Candidatus Hodarchaeota archaeon]